MILPATDFTDESEQAMQSMNRCAIKIANAKKYLIMMWSSPGFTDTRGI